MVERLADEWEYHWIVALMFRVEVLSIHPTSGSHGILVSCRCTCILHDTALVSCDPTFIEGDKA